MIALLKSWIMPGNLRNSNPVASRVIALAILGWVALLAIMTTRLFLNARPSSRSAPISTAGDVKTSPTVTSEAKLRTQSCATSNCHGSLSPDIAADHAIRGDEYFVWLNDPHALAFQTLHAERSREMFLRLGVQEGDLYGTSNAFQKHWQNCLGCHETSVQLLDHSQSVQQSSFVPEGVSCESCHGDSKDWLHRHYRKGWNQQAETQQKVALNFFHENDPGSRIRQCSNCHVGSEKGEVNHDLIAAGHPPLRFEYVWYKSRLPKHWKPNRHAQLTKDDNPTAANVVRSQAREWLIGQLVTSIVTLEQLERRASRKDANPSWPELSEYDCFSCHHDLSRPTWRSDRIFSGASGIDPFKSKVVIPWGNWNLEFLQLMADEFELKKTRGSNEAKAFSVSLGVLRDAVNNRYALTDQLVAEKCAIATNELAAWSFQITELPEEESLELLRQIARNQPHQLISSWDRVSTILLGFAAHYQGSKEFPDALKRGMTQLRFPDQPTTFDSPRNFRSGEATNSLTDDQWIDLLSELAHQRAKD